MRPKSRPKSGDETAPALYSAEAEQVTLGGLMVFDEAPALVGQVGLTHDDFHDEAHRHIWDAIQTVRAAGAEPGTITVFEALRAAQAADLAGGLPYLNALTQSALSARHTASLALIVKDRATRRKLAAIGQALQQAAGGPLGAEELRARVEALGFELQRTAAPAGPQSPIPLHWVNDRPAELQAPRQIVEGVLTAGGMSLFYGESNSGKSYMAIHLCICLSSGLPWLGRRTERGAVIYVAAEGAWSIWLRVAAYRQHYGQDVGRLGLIPSALNLVDPSADVDALVALINAKAAELGEPVALIVVDTVARVMGGADENSAPDMGRLISAGDRIRQATGAHLLYIHHAGKDAARGARGHSSLRAALDTEIEVTASEGTALHTARITKQRDLPGKGDRITCRFVSVALGQDQWGKAITACAVVDADSADAANAEPRLTPSEQAVYDFLMTRSTGIRRPELVELMRQQGVSKASVYRAVSALTAADLVTDTLGLVYAPKGGEQGESHV